jgi:penicillin-binding protein 2
LKYLENRKYVIQAIFFVVGAIFALKLFFIQVLNAEYKHAADANTIKRKVEYPYRGLIYDRKGKLLVQNLPVYDIMVIPKEVKNIDTLRFCRLFKIHLEEFRQKLAAAKAYSYVKPSPFLQKLSPEEFAALEDNLVEFPAFTPTARTVRSYPHQSLAHALGYIGEISPRQLEDSSYAAYSPGDYLGVSGIERTYEKILMGRKGVKYRMVNVRGIDKGPFKQGQYDTAAVAGQSIVSSIDLDLQQYAEKLLKGKRGGVVAIEPSTGEVLAFVSAPFYDPNLLTGKELGNNYMALFREPGKPLFNRPLKSTNPPGSVFKLVQALIGLQEGVINPETGFPCNQSLVKCAHGHPHPSNLYLGIENSCNPYFYRVFQSVVNQGKYRNIFQDTHSGLDQWREKVLSFGFAGKLGIDLPFENSGIIASSNFYDKRYGKTGWKYPTIYSMSIGQGETGSTPLQLANLMAIIANRGYYYPPHLIKGIGNSNKPLPPYEERKQVLVDSRHFEPVIQGMSQVMSSRWGTGWYANISHLGIEVCGKTGTVQNPHGMDHAVFAAFAPRQNPKIAIAVYIENAGFGSQSAAPLATLMIEKYIRGSISQNARRQWWEEYIVSGGFYKEKKHH